MPTILSVTASIIVAFGGAGAIILALSSWLGKVWATRIAERERATFATDLEKYRAELSELSVHRQDALVRRRDVYAELASSMRIFLGNTRRATDDQIHAFERAYDVSYLWASAEVVEAAGQLLDAIATNVAKPGSVPQEKLKESYASCLRAMRRDSGFADTAARYRVYSF